MLWDAYFIVLSDRSTVPPGDGNHERHEAANAVLNLWETVYAFNHDAPVVLVP